MAQTKYRHGVSLQGQQPMPLAGFLNKGVPLAAGKTAVQTGPDCVDGGMKPVKITFRFHSDDAGTVRTTKAP